MSWFCSPTVTHHVMGRCSKHLQFLIGNAYTVILHVNQCFCISFLYANENGASSWIVYLRIGNQITDGPVKQIFIPVYNARCQLVIRCPFDWILFLQTEIEKIYNALPSHCDKVYRLWIHWLHIVFQF